MVVDGTKTAALSMVTHILQHQLGGIFAWGIDADNGAILNSLHQGPGHTEQ